MPKNLTNGCFLVVNVQIWYANENYDYREMGFEKEYGNQLYVVFTKLDEQKNR